MANTTFRPFVKIEKSEYEKKDIETYGEITLKFGQYKDCRIKDIIEGDEDYARWVYTTMISKNEYDSPTNKAIKKYFQHKLEM